MTQDMLVLTYSTHVLSPVKSDSEDTTTSKIGRLLQSERLQGSIWFSIPHDQLIFTKVPPFLFKASGKWQLPTSLRGDIFHLQRALTIKQFLFEYKSMWLN